MHSCATNNRFLQQLLSSTTFTKDTTDPRLRSLLQRVTGTAAHPLCHAHDKAITHCLPEHSAAQEMLTLTTDGAQDAADIDAGTPADPAWRALLLRLQRLLTINAGRRAPPSPLHIEAIAARLEAERAVWAGALRDDPPWGAAGIPTALRALMAVDGEPLLPPSLPGSSGGHPLGTFPAGLEAQSAAVLLAACFASTRASAAACADAVQRALQRYQAAVTPHGRYRAAVHAAALEAATAELKGVSMGVLTEEGTHQLHAACAAVFAGWSRS